MKKTIFLLICGLITLSGVQARKKKENVAHIPILAWTSIPPGEFATLEHYQELRDAGFDYSLSWTTSLNEAIHTMDLAAKVGVKMVFMCPELGWTPSATPSWRATCRLMFT